MIAPTDREAFELLCMHAAAEGREEALFGDSLSRVRRVVPAFLEGGGFPGVYFEFPLAGRPCLDVNVLYEGSDPGARIESDVAGDCEGLLRCFAEIHRRHTDTKLGFEIDTSRDEVPQAGVHFQTGPNAELALPVCERLGEWAKGRLYVEAARRMRASWPLAYFGLFRGRPEAPLRVCGYLDAGEKDACADSPARIAEVFRAAGFAAWDETMLAQVAGLMRIAPAGLDFQFDIDPDGSLGDMFSMDFALHEATASAARASFARGPAFEMLRQLADWGIADARATLIPQSALSCAFPVTRQDGAAAGYALYFMPRWIKVRWKNRQLQPSKCYCRLWGGVL